MSRRYKKKNKTTHFVLIVFVIIVAFLIHKNKLADTNHYYETITGLNVRTGIGKKYPISFTLEKGDKVKVISKKGAWYKINYNGKIGYAYSGYMVKQSGYDTELLLSDNYKQALIFIGVVILSIIVIYYCLIFYRKNRNTRLLKTVTDISRGTASERDLVLRLLKYSIPNEHIFHDLFLKIGDKKFSQIDLIAVTDVGLIVFEVKDYSGWIYGNGDKPEWTQVLAYGKQKYRFHNPILQNSKHIYNLRNILNEYRNIPIYSVIVFYGKCVLKNINFVPQQTFVTRSERIYNVLQTISTSNVFHEYKDKNKVIEILRDATINGGIIENQNQHIANVRNMLGTDRIFD